MAFDYGAYGRSNLSASSPTDQELDYHYGLSLEEWARDKPLSILQLDPADRAVLRIAGTQAPLENFSLQLSLKSWFRSVEHTAGYSRCPFFFSQKFFVDIIWLSVRHAHQDGRYDNFLSIILNVCVELRNDFLKNS
jgi:hypothetical protein